MDAAEAEPEKIEKLIAEMEKAEREHSRKCYRIARCDSIALKP